MEEESKKNVYFFKRMCLSLYDYQSKASRYRNGLAYLKNRVITNEKKYNRFIKTKKKGTQA